MKLSVTEFLLPFFPDENESLYLFGYSPKEIPEEIKEQPNRIKTNRRELKNNRALQQRVKMINETQGIYFTVNSGGTRKDEINRINAVFCEIDDRPIIEQHDIFDNASIPPSIRVETKKSVHAYWLLSEKFSIDQFIFIQRGLIEHFKSDKAIKNQNRVMRLPFFNHLTFELGEYVPKPVIIHSFNNYKYSFAELCESYPAPKDPEPIKYQPLDYQDNSDDWETVFEEVRRRIASLPGYHREHAENLSSARGVCHNGDSNRTLVVCHTSGKVFCRNQCTYPEIMRALGVDPPTPKKKIYNIPRVPAKQQSSLLYQWIKKREESRGVTA